MCIDTLGDNLLCKMVEAHTRDDYAQPRARDTAYTRHFQQTLSDHLSKITRPGCLFEDTAVTGTRWRGQVRRVRATLYRRLKPNGRMPLSAGTRCGNQHARVPAENIVDTHQLTL